MRGDELVGDRFVPEAVDRWFDLVTGATARVDVRRTAGGWEELTRRCEAELAGGRTGSALIDFGRVGVDGWFEARAIEPPSGDRPLSAAERARVALVVERVMRSADVREGSGLLRVLTEPLDPHVLPHALSRAARALRTIGYVSLGAPVALPAPLRARLLHRHVALFDLADKASEWVTWWARALAEASPRAHLIVSTRGSPRRLSLLKPSVARAEGSRHPAEITCARGTTRAARLATVDAFIAAGRLDAADAALSALRLQDDLAGRTAEDGVRERWAALRFWQGRIEEAAAVGGGSTECLVWRGVTAWVSGDAAVLRECVTALARASAGTDSVRACWAGVLGFWLKGGERPGPRAGRVVGRLMRRTSVELGPLAILRHALAVEALVAAGRRGTALRIARGWRPREPDCALAHALADWLEAKCGTARACDTERRALAFVRRSGARGVCLWGTGRGVMNLLQRVSTLLQLVHDAEDEHAALKRGCSWVREHGGADAVGIVSHPGAAFVVSDGLGRADLETTDMREVFENGGRTVAEGPHAIVAAPVRYGGVTIGFAVVRGRREAASTLAEASGALASACAPALRARLDALALSSTGRALASEILGASPAMTGVREAIARAAGTTVPVLVEGESGTGKELVARALHRLSPRRDRRICAVNCAALTDELVEAELFGHARGAFTGAIGTRLGLFEEAHLGTLFLDEVSELSPRAQAKLLRVLQEREIRRLGENAPRPIDVRLIAATNQPLAAVVGRGGFREDLLFRLAVVRIRVPPLRDRIEDVPLLAHTFWKRMLVDLGKHVQLGADAVAALCRHRWPGNIRELQNVIAALAVAAPTRGRVSARHVGLILAEGTDRDGPSGETLDQARQAFERRVIAAALARHAGRRTGAARELGISRQGLAKAIRRLGLEGRRGSIRAAIDGGAPALPAAASE